MTEKRNTETPNMVTIIEEFINRYLHFGGGLNVAFPLALWTIATYMFLEFDAFPYIVITSDTKRAGKTTLMEILSFMCCNPQSANAMMSAPATFFKIIDEVQPTIFFDEAEELNSEAATMMRSIINVGYRRGGTIPRFAGKVMKNYKTYSPKVFVLIGSTFDTLTDRSIIVRMARGVPAARYAYDSCQAEGAMIREAIDLVLHDPSRGVGMTISETYQQVRDKGLSFLTARDEQIWAGIFAVATVMCPERLTELSRIAVDLCMEKTLDKRDYRELIVTEKKAEQDEFVIRLLNDMVAVMSDKQPATGETLVTALRNIPTAPWRRFRGAGLTVHNIADMLSAVGVKTKVTRFGNGRKESKTLRAYHYKDVVDAVKRNTETAGD